MNMKRTILFGMSIMLGQQLSAQVPRSLVGKTFYNTNLWHMEPRFGGVPTVKFDSPNKATVKKGDIVENAVVKKYKNGLIVTTNYRKLSDTFRFEKMPAALARSAEAEMRDQRGQLWSTRFPDQTANAAALRSYPEAKEGHKRHVINLPERDHEERMRIEIYAGVNQEVDCNSYGLTGTIEPKILDGFGHQYYEVQTDGQLIGTLKACADGITTLRYINMLPTMTGYNSRTPIVIYAPQNVQIRYKIYETNDHWEFARPQ